MPRPPAQPSFSGPLRKTQRPMLIGVDPAKQSDGPDRDSEDPAGANKGALKPQLSPSHEVQPDTKELEPSEIAKPRLRQPAEDRLLAAVLAGRGDNRTIPITRLDPELHGTLRIISSRTGVTIQDLVNGAVRGWLSENQQALISNGVLEA